MVVYYDKELRLKIKDMIDKRRISVNLCYLCLAYLNERINYSKKSYDYLIPKRNKLAKLLKDHGIESSVILEKIKSIHEDSYPTLKQINTICAMIQNDVVIFSKETIPDEYIKYKTEMQYEADIARVTRQKQNEIENGIVGDIIDYIKENFKRIPVEKINEKKIKAIKGDYSYELILDTIKIYQSEIMNALDDDTLDEKGVFEYFLGIIKNKLPERYKYVKHREEQEGALWRMNAHSIYVGENSIEEKVQELCSYEVYAGEELFVSERLEKALVELEESESYRAICEREQEEINRRNKVAAEYKSTRKKLNTRLEDLW